MNKTFKLIVSLLIPQVAGGVGGLFTSSAVKDWYPVLAKPALNPPAWVFGPVWTVLFLLMGYALYLVWREWDQGNPSTRLRVKIALAIFGLQLFLNALWSIIFFGSTSLTIHGLNNIGIALVEIVFLWLAILATIIAFAKISKPAAWLLAPYILWVSFAMYLNYSIYTLN